jgi:hypothetical protein
MKTIIDKAADTGELDPRIQQAIAGRNRSQGAGWATASTWLATARKGFPTASRSVKAGSTHHYAG